MFNTWSAQLLCGRGRRIGTDSAAGCWTPLSYLRGGSEKIAPSALTVLEPALRHFSPPVQVPPEARIRTHRYKLGITHLIAFERNIVWQMSEDLKQAGGNEALEKPVKFEAKLAAPEHVYDLRAGKYLGLLQSIPVDLDPWQPSLYALTKAMLPEGDIVAELEKVAHH